MNVFGLSLISVLLCVVGVLCAVFIEPVRNWMANSVVKYWWVYALILVGCIGLLVWQIVHFHLY